MIINKYKRILNNQFDIYICHSSLSLVLGFLNIMHKRNKDELTNKTLSVISFLTGSPS